MICCEESTADGQSVQSVAIPICTHTGKEYPVSMVYPIPTDGIQVTGLDQTPKF